MWFVTVLGNSFGLSRMVCQFYIRLDTAILMLSLCFDIISCYLAALVAISLGGWGFNEGL